jgi:DNA polymerase-3 subunit delta'
LEEPPPGIVFLFTAVRLENILPTIRSRCQIFQLFPVEPDLIAEWLVRQGVSQETALKRAAASQGLPGQAVTVDEVQLPQGISCYSELIGQDLLQLLKTSGELEKKDRQEIIMILRVWESQARDELLRIGRLNPAEAVKVSGLNLVFGLEKIAQAVRMIESNVNQRLALDQLFIAIKAQMGYK